MNVLSASRAEASTETPPSRPVLVWDAPVRVFHWLMVLSFAGAYLTAESERWRMLHVTLGYTMAGLVGFRIVWGLVGSRYARFSSFVRGPAAVMDYLRSLLRGQPKHSTGHNPAGGVAIVLLLAAALALTASGWATFNQFGAEWWEDVHETVANLMLAIVGVHVAGVLLSSWMHGENLVHAMVTGRKAARPEEGLRSAWRSVAALMLVAVLGLWWLQWQTAPAAGGLMDRPAAASKLHDDD